jgi:hypothetical protein
VYLVRRWPPAPIGELPADTIVLVPEQGSMPIFGDVEVLEDGEAGVVVWSGTWYSVVTPDGEPGTAPLGIEARVLTPEEFELARRSGWRSMP